VEGSHLVKYQYLPGKTGENHEKLQSGYLTSELKSKFGASRIQNKWANHFTMTVSYLLYSEKYESIPTPL
jgi:hypothetical protein